MLSLHLVPARALTATTILALVAAAPAAAGDVLVTLEGVVAFTSSGGVPSSPFGNPAIGLPFTLELSVFTPGIPFSGTLYDLDPTGSRLTIGATSVLLDPLPLNGLEMIDNDFVYGDWISFEASITGSPGVRAGGVLFDSAGTMFATEDVGALSGQTLDTVFTTQLYRVVSNDGSITLSVDTVSFDALTPQAIGTTYCMAVPNSTGAAGELSAVGLAAPAQNSLRLTASVLPAQQTGLFLASMTQGFIANPGNSTGNVCLGGAIGRFYGPGQVQSSGPSGSIQLNVDLTAIPQGSGTSPVLSGETWNFQLWHRDVAESAATSNFTKGLSVTFQ